MSAAKSGPAPFEAGSDPGQPAAVRTPVAVVGTLAEFRRDPVPYDLSALVRFVRGISPDLLCLDMTLEQWQRRDFGGLPVEYRDALLPLADQTDIVVVPIGDPAGARAVPLDEPVAFQGIRGWWLGRLYSACDRLQRGAHSPVAVGEGPRHATAELLLHLVDYLRTPKARKAAKAHRAVLAERTVEMARRDPCRRILVVVNARYCHQLRRALRKRPGVALVRHSSL